MKPLFRIPFTIYWVVFVNVADPMTDINKWLLAIAVKMFDEQNNRYIYKLLT
jgi:hypothetical protein